MTKAVLLAVCAAVLLSAGSAHAGSKLLRSGGVNDWKKQRLIDEESRRARAVGGYNDPVTALRNVLNGRATAKDIGTGVVSHIFDTPGFGTLRLKSRYD